MPTYDYKCTKCGNVREIFTKYTDEESKKCEYCEDFTMTRSITGTNNFEFKGEGTQGKGKVRHGKN